MTISTWSFLASGLAPGDRTENPFDNRRHPAVPVPGRDARIHLPCQLFSLRIANKSKPLGVMKEFKQAEILHEALGDRRASSAEAEASFYPEIRDPAACF